MQKQNTAPLGSWARRLFVIDLLGALASAVLLGVVLPRFEPLFGMPQAALHVLAALPLLFACYSLACLVTRRAHKARLLRPLAILNAGYCVVSVVYVVMHASALRPLGWLYFGGELAIVLALAALEWRASR